MKKITAILLAMLMLLCGCGKDAKTDGGADDNATAIQLGGTTVCVDSELTAQQKEALGEPVSIQQAPSCHYEGMDTVYEYEGFMLQTYRKDDADWLCLVEITSADYATAEGITVGATLEAVKKAYGEPSESTEYYLVYDITQTVTLTVDLEDGKVSAILYEETV